MIIISNNSSYLININKKMYEIQSPIKNEAPSRNHNSVGKMSKTGYLPFKKINHLRLNQSPKQANGKFRSSYKNDKILAGNADLLYKNDVIFEENEVPGTAVYVAKNGKYIGYILLKDVVRDKAKILIICPCNFFSRWSKMHMDEESANLLYSLSV